MENETLSVCWIITFAIGVIVFACGIFSLLKTEQTEFAAMIVIGLIIGLIGTCAGCKLWDRAYKSAHCMLVCCACTKCAKDK